MRRGPQREVRDKSNGYSHLSGSERRDNWDVVLEVRAQQDAALGVGRGGSSRFAG